MEKRNSPCEGRKEKKMEKRNMQCEGRKEEKNGEKAEGFSGVEGERDGAHRLREGLQGRKREIEKD
uniref:Uncharacterized protein n=1 Tax=Cucumis melo TaxID=3656 RepID=A0A9I9CQG9_CUCME